jgi:hypothetical protein
MLKKSLIILSLSLFLIPISEVRATSTPFLVTYFLNEVSSNITANPLVDPVKLNFVAEGNVENWVSVKIENVDDSSIYKNYVPGLDCDNTDRCEQVWDGKISDSSKTLTDGIYKIVVHVKNISAPSFDLTLTSPYTITVNTSTSTSDTTAPVITLLGEAIVNLLVGDTYTDAGVTVMDDIDASTTITGLPIDTSATGTQYVIYTATDSSSNSASTTRTINIATLTAVEVPTPTSSSGSYVQNISFLLANPNASSTEGQVLGTSTSRISEETRQRRLAHFRRRLLEIKRELLLLEHPELREILLAEDPLAIIPTTTPEMTIATTVSTSTEPAKKPFWKFW